MTRIRINIEDLFNLPTAIIYNPDEFKSADTISTDTRTIKKNSIFVALKGEKFDGHSFVNEAIKKGVNAIIIEKDRLIDFDNVNITIITVADTTKAYGNLANIWRNKLKAKIIALTGSNGKTTTKEILSTILGQKYSVCKTVLNNNNHIGVPLTLFSATSKNNFVVLELGTNHFGEIAYTANIAQPDYALVTNIGDGHLEFLKNKQGVAKEKTALYKETLIAGGSIFVNTDDELLKQNTKTVKKKITFGFKGSPTIKGKLLGLSIEGKPKIRISYKTKQFDVEIGLPGLINANNFLAAAAIALTIGISQKDIQKAAKQLTGVDKRLNIIKKENITLINDTYNANPESMKAAFEFMDTFPKGIRRIAVLGDMFELGDKSLQAHERLAVHIRKNKVDEIYSVGKFMKALDNKLKKTKIISKHFNNRKALEKFLANKHFSNSIILLKGSRGMKMEEFLKLF